MVDRTLERLAQAVAVRPSWWVHDQITEDLEPWRLDGVRLDSINEFLSGRSDKEARQYVRVKLFEGVLQFCFPETKEQNRSWGACHAAKVFLCASDNTVGLASWGICSVSGRGPSGQPLVPAGISLGGPNVVMAYNRVLTLLALPLLLVTSRRRGVPRLPPLDFVFFVGECDYGGGRPSAPVFAMARWGDSLKHNAVLLPWWEHLHDFSKEVAERYRTPEPAWSERQDVLFWRGKFTHPVHMHAQQSVRARLVELSARAGRRLGLDAQFVEGNASLVDVADGDYTRPTRGGGYMLGLSGLEFKYSQTNRTSAPYAPPETWRRYRYLIDMEGTSYSGRLYWILHSGSLCFRSASALRFWYWRKLSSFCVLVATNLTDLPGKLASARKHVTISRQMAEHARAWARSEEGAQVGVYAYLWRVLQAYGHLQRFETTL